jgi:uncharacterized membrane protein
MARVKQGLLWLMGLFYLSAGIMHFVNAAFFIRIVPDYLPWHAGLVYVSGVCEIALGALVLLPATRRLAAWGIIALLIAVFPANINMLVHRIPMQEGMPPNMLALWVRLPLQGLLIAWAWWYTRPPGAPTSN